VGYSHAADGSQRYEQFFASASASFQLNDKLGGFLEGYGFSRESVDGSATYYADAGLSYLVSSDLALDVRVGTGLDKPHPHWFTGLGLSVRF
jgi:hypothetical protein